MCWNDVMAAELELDKEGALQGGVRQPQYIIFCSNNLRTSINFTIA